MLMLLWLWLWSVWWWLVSSLWSIVVLLYQSIDRCCCCYLFKIVQDCSEKLGLRAIAANVLGAVLARLDDLSNCILDTLTIGDQAQMLKHVGWGQEHGSWVGDVATSGRWERVSSAGLEDGDLVWVGLAGHDARSADQSDGKISNDVSIQVGQNHNVELLRLGNQLKTEEE